MEKVNSEEIDIYKKIDLFGEVLEKINKEMVKLNETYPGSTLSEEYMAPRMAMREYVLQQETANEEAKKAAKAAVVAEKKAVKAAAAAEKKAAKVAVAIDVE